MKIREASKLTKYYCDVKALDKVSFSVLYDTNFGQLGMNGAGKTSFIRIVNQIIKHTSGSIFFCRKVMLLQKSRQ
jgi:ABC-type multidrug transport system ATPase subunit